MMPAALTTSLTRREGQLFALAAQGATWPPGTVLWSNPGVGTAVYSLVPAVPSSEGVADVFAFHEDGTVEAVTSEGATAWTADINGSAWYMPGYVVPDFQGGLVFVKMGEEEDSVVRLDGLTGQPTTLYTVSHEDPRMLQLRLGVHPDGTIFVAA